MSQNVPVFHAELVVAWRLNELRYSEMESFNGLPILPDRIGELGTLAFDLWWTWNQGAREVFRRLDYPL